MAKEIQTKGKITVRSRQGPSNADGKRKRGPSRNKDSGDEDAGDNEQSDEEEESALGEEEELDTDEEITAAQSGKSKKTAKRKRRATSPSTFGAALQDLLGDEHTSDVELNAEQDIKSSQPAILSLAPHIRRGALSSKLNAKAARLALAARKKREDRAHVRDVIGGWGAPGQVPKTKEGNDKLTSLDEGEQLKSWLQEGGVQGYEKKLRKSAQRGVVKLFNAIRAAQSTTEEDLKDEKKVAKRNASAHTAAEKRTSTSGNALGGKTKAVNELSKNNFFDLLRAGTKTKTAAL